MNELGTDMAAASVAVYSKPDPPSGKPSISSGPDRIAVAWCGPPYDGGCMITGFIIEMQQLSAGLESNSATETDWQEVATVVDSLAYTVKNLKPQTAYRFRVRAENLYGRSEPSLPSDRVELAAEDLSVEETDFNRPICVKSGGDFKNRFEILEELGKGRFGIVYKVQEKEEPHQVLAAKIIKCIKSRDREKVKEEISIMNSLKHPKLLQLAASFESARELVMVMEYITGGELFERVVADDFTLTELDCILFLRQICEGVDYMHSQSIVHLDLKPENIMCHTRTSHQIKIIDFGLAQRLNDTLPVRVLFGTPEFIPPEIISYEPIGFQSDMWSVGVICYVLLSGLSPFMGDSDVETFANITRADYDFDDEAFDCISQEAKDFIGSLLIHRKERRLTAKECLKSKWLTQGHDENLSNNKICTDKLKKFIIRRKWQKTGNAIRALGRMATLSASRRNSAVSNSLPTSPRPSVSGTSIFNPNLPVQMSSLHEEDDDFSIELPTLDAQRRMQQSLKVRDKSYCSERSDSGYSECSTCSGGPCHCIHATKDSERDGSETVRDESIVLSIAVPHDVLKSKLELIVKHSDAIISSEGIKDKMLITGKQYKHDIGINENREQQVEIQFASSGELTTGTTVTTTTKEPIMRSDFTNTIKMRKKSLENSVIREKVKQPKAVLETSGKVSMLKTKFSCPANNSLTVSHAASINRSYKSKDCMDLAKNKNVLNRFACNNKTNGTPQLIQKSEPAQSISMPNSPLPTRANASIRLSPRVREATERLSQQQTISSSIRRNSPERLENRNGITSAQHSTRHILTFKKS
ncbi:myosin light chain kinase, smooth muscle-like [Teleopsis dalmanni]|uniref:myosin light chain kinase, smooth muscle-like n=1 Tax=Teleopsis dalmanni TaxID=139649 RepID=UPI0018CCC05B|nr:myosin light chain kinase, smooth muscle-like [Teleopsis dalmanni]